MRRLLKLCFPPELFKACVEKRLRRATLILAMACWSLSGCHSTTPEPEHNAIEATSSTQLRISPTVAATLKLIKVQTEELPDILRVMGRISPTEDRTTVVPSRVSGRIQSILIASGESAKAGQELATIFSPDFVAAKEEYLLALRQTKAKDQSDAGEFSSLVKMARKRLSTMGLSPKDIDNLATPEKLKASEDDLDTNSNAGASLIVRAPRAGAVITKNAVIGNSVNVGDTLFTIADLSKVWFLGDLYPEDLDKVKKDQEVLIDVNPGKPSQKGKVSFISPVIDATARTIKIRVLMDNPNLELRADMYVQGGVVLSREKVLAIPSGAVVKDGGNNYVFKIVKQELAENKLAALFAEKVRVDLGREHNGRTGVKAGLKENDQIVAEDALLLDQALTSSDKAEQ